MFSRNKVKRAAGIANAGILSLTIIVVIGLVILNNLPLYRLLLAPHIATFVIFSVIVGYFRVKKQRLYEKVLKEEFLKMKNETKVHSDGFCTSVNNIDDNNNNTNKNNNNNIFSNDSYKSRNLSVVIIEQ